MKSGDKNNDDKTKRITGYMDEFIEDNKVKGQDALQSAKKAKDQNSNSMEYLKELAGAKHSLIFYFGVKGVKASLFSCEGDTEAEVMLPPQMITAERIHAMDSVAILSASVKMKEQISRSNQKIYEKNKQLLTDIFHTIINNPDTVVISAGEGRVSNIIATVTPNKLSAKNGSVKAGQYNLTEIFKNVDLTDLSLSDDDLNQSVNYFVQNKQFFMLRPYLNWTPDSWPMQPSKEDWNNYFQNKIADDKNENHELNVHDTHLAHQLGINSQSTGIFHLSNALFRDTTSAILPNAESILKLKKGKLNDADELSSALMQAFVTGILVADAINKHSDTYECVVRGETNSVKSGVFEDKGISSVGYGRNSFLQTQFIPAIEKSNSAQALINATKILEIITMLPAMETRANLDALEKEIKWMNEEDKEKFYNSPNAKTQLHNLREKVKNTNISVAVSSPLSLLPLKVESNKLPQSEKPSFSGSLKKTNAKIHAPLSGKNMLDSMDDFVVSHAGGSKAKWNPPKETDIPVFSSRSLEKPKSSAHHGDELIETLAEVFGQLNQIEDELKVMGKRLKGDS